MSNSALEWSEKYNTGHLVIDENHEYLFRLLEQATKAADNCESPDYIQTVLNQLLDYTQTHFRDEEALMITLNYPNLAQHRRSHISLLDSVEDMLDEHRGGMLTLSRSLLTFLRQWVCKHIMEEDAKFAAWVKQKKHRSDN